MLAPADVAVIEDFCKERIAPEASASVRLEAEVHGNTVTIVERRVPWQGGDGEWTAQSVARLRFTATAGTWTLFWPDRNDRWHTYDGVAPTTNVADLLQEIDRDPTGIFWG